jgi:DNA-binding beta-propeller fold protein YncE/ABC-type Fe3+ transport system permease subunit
MSVRAGVRAVTLAAAALWLGAVAVPAIAALAGLRDIVLPPQTPSPLRILAVSGGWALAVAAGAVLLGWLPGRLLGHALARRGYSLLAAACLVPLALPSYLVFYAWWQMWPPDSPLHAWAVHHDAVLLLRRATLYLGLVSWSWPLVAWCVSGAVVTVPLERRELLRLDGAGPARLALDRLRTDGPGLALGGLCVFLLTFGNTTNFDLANERSFGNELRAAAERGASPGGLVVMAWPAIALSAALVAAAWLALAARPPAAARRVERSGRGAALVTVVAFGLALLPLALLLGQLRHGAGPGEFLRLYGEGTLNSALLAAAVGCACATVAAGQWLLRLDGRPAVRLAAGAQATTWILAAVLPAPVVAAALEAAYNAPWTVALYRSPLILLLGHAARVCVVGALVGRWLAAGEPHELALARRADGVSGLGGLARAAGPRLLGGVCAAWGLGAVLSLGEIAVTARLAPPGFDAVAGSVLNAMHYQRPDVPIWALAALLVLASLVALVLSTIRLMWRGPATRAAVALLLLATLPGCSPEGTAGPGPLRPRLVIGPEGGIPAAFQYPRGLAIDPEAERVYVVDKSARVRRFGFDGRPQAEWRMPEHELGKPTGISVAPDGRVFLADTHYHRVVAFDGAGRELLRFGRYGEGPGEFIYPTDVAFGPGDRLYVSEYGGNDRIQVFDAAGAYLFGFGSWGSDPGQLSRPQAIEFSRDRRELFVADACNHRIQVFDPEGRLLRVLGRVGRAEGELCYPYGLTLLPGGDLIVSEFGNSRLQRLGGGGGEPRGVIGVPGTGPGQLKTPWSVGAADALLFVLDSGNNRVQVIGMPALDLGG